MPKQPKARTPGPPSEAAIIAAWEVIASTRGYGGAKIDQGRSVAGLVGVSVAEGIRAVTAIRAYRDACVADDMRDAVRGALPMGAVVVYDTRSPRRKNRTLAPAVHIVEHAMGRALSSSGDGIEWESFDGGGVPNRYGYPAETDRADIARIAGCLLVRLARVKARTASYGRVGDMADQRPDLTWVHTVLTHGRRVYVTAVDAIPDDPGLAVALDAHLAGVAGVAP
jgi:hypothetical protein